MNPNTDWKNPLTWSGLISSVLLIVQVFVQIDAEQLETIKLAVNGLLSILVILGVLANRSEPNMVVSLGIKNPKIVAAFAPKKKAA